MKDDHVDAMQTGIPKTTSTPVQSKSSKKLTLMVDKTRFICNAVIFNHHPTTLLGKMFSPQMLRPGLLS